MDSQFVMSAKGNNAKSRLARWKLIEFPSRFSHLLPVRMNDTRGREHFLSFSDFAMLTSDLYHIFLVVPTLERTRSVFVRR
jgi:hypothetical protein